ncbi:hypothetical protein GCU60_01550 [Blastococcus saxobsidens]|uniref:PH domain-containing protein n=1 Tax=Blastococcus saxobsidens TaxID=138336 RepID=A0A6L9VZ42_9ACTN|nr:hypothetical protein [Blastococcus saxobsidens]NEK84450.1 hypothetical protein [Blastococcus saxobsidens]
MTDRRASTDGTPAVPGEVRVLLGRCGTPLIVFSALGIVGSFVFAWGWIADDLPTPPGDMLVTLLPLVLGVIVLGLLATARIVGSSTGHVVVIGLFVVHRVPVHEIVELAPRGPLAIRTASGRRVRSIAYGQSLIGEVAGCPRSRRASDRITEFCHRMEADGNGRGGSECSVGLRGGEMLVALLSGVLLVAVTVVLNQA